MKNGRLYLSSWLLRPPYDGVIWLAWLYIVFACVYAGGGPFKGDLIWFDDRVRLVQIFDWLNGQGWYDRTIARVNAPDGFHTIWSRIVDLPAAGIIALFQNFVGQMQAGMIAAIIIPLIETLLLFLTIAWFSTPLIGRERAKLVTLFVVFCSAINPEKFTLAGFQVGMLSHHSWYVLLVFLVWGTCSRLIKDDVKHTVLIGGAAIGGLLMVGIEGLPLMAGASAMMGLIGWWQNRPTLILNMARMTALGALLGLLTVPANQPPGQWLTISFAEPSIFGPIIIGAIALFFGIHYLILKYLGTKREVAFIAIAVLAAVFAALFFWSFPELLNGAAAGLSPEERRLALKEHQEAMTLWELKRNLTDFVRMMVPPLLAIGFGYCWIRRMPDPQQKALGAFHVGLVAMTLALAYNLSRFFHYVDLSASPWLLLLWLDLTERLARDAYFGLKSFVIYFLIGPLWLWIVPGANYNQYFGTSVLLYPAKVQTEPPQCGTSTITSFIDAHYSSDKTLIAPMYFTDYFLLHTHLKLMFLANFPSQNRFIDEKNFYEGGSAEESGAIALRHNVDLVTICRSAYLVSERSHFTNALLKGRMSFGQLLVTGQYPDWLKPVQTEGSTEWLLFAVDRDKLAHANP